MNGPCQRDDRDPERFDASYYRNVYGVDAAPRFSIPWWANRYYARLCERLLRRCGGRALLDVGCGQGFLLGQVRGGADRWGIEVSEYAAARCATFAPGARVLVGDIETGLPAGLAARRVRRRRRALRPRAPRRSGRRDRPLRRPRPAGGLFPLLGPQHHFPRAPPEGVRLVRPPGRDPRLPSASGRVARPRREGRAPGRAGLRRRPVGHPVRQAGAEAPPVRDLLRAHHPRGAARLDGPPAPIR